MNTNVKGDAYEGLLEENAADVKGGTGQYFTPRALINAIVEVIRSKPDETLFAFALERKSGFERS